MTENMSPLPASDSAAIEDMYPLTPLQRGLLFHLLRDPESTDYLSQVTCRMHGVQVTDIARAWQLVVDRHPVLRTGFLWEGLDEPVQVVYRWAPLPVTVHDLCPMDPHAREREITDFLETDRCQSFRPDRAPLARLALFRVEPDVVQVVWTHHAMVADGWSGALLTADLERVFAALAAGTTPPPVTGPGFRDYIGRVLDRDPAEDAAYWRETLAGVVSATPLPLTGRRGDGDVRTGGATARYQLELSTSESNRVRAVAKELRVPFGVLAQGAWALTLARHADVDDVVFGLVVSGRTMDLPGVERVVGLLTNTVPVRADFPRGITTGDWLRRIALRHADTLAHEHTPLAEIRRHTGITGTRPLFETVLLVQNFPVPQDGGETGAPGRISGAEGYESIHYPLALFVIPGDRITLRVAYHPDVVGADDAELVARCVRAALIGLAEPARPLDTVPVFAALEPAPSAPVRGPDRQWPQATVPEVFAGVVAANPGAIAVTATRGTMTYRALDAHAERLAGLLVRHGTEAESRIAVLLERSIDSVAAMLGVLKAGGVYVPVDPAYPAPWIRDLLTDSVCRIVITRSDLIDLLGPELRRSARVVRIDELPDELPDGAPAGDTGRVAVRPDNLAYVVYTSGSTGSPKGVMVSHRAVLNTLRWSIDEFRLGPGDVVAHKVPVGFTDAIFEVLWPLCAGATVAVLDDAVVRDPDAFCAALRERGVTYTQMSPRQIDAVTTAVPGDADPLPGLTGVINAAEPLPVAFAQRWDSVCAQARINNIYGMTESAIFATAVHLPWGLAARLDAVPIGLPIANVTARVLNRVLEPCPAGIAGELYLGGTGIARGYLGRPGKTAERFVPDPSGPPGARLYRTGDVVRWSVENGLDYVGRNDFQVKVRGLRVEPGTVEAALRDHPEIRDAVVVGHDGRLAGHLLPVGSSRPAPRTIRAWLARRLPEHMVPTTMMWLDELPMTAHGKVDRRRLPEPSGERDLTDPPEPPRTPVERTLGDIWTTVLGIDHIGIHDDFFQLGGDSLLAVRLVGRVRAVIPVDYTVGMLFDAPTIAGGARRVAGLLDSMDQRLGELLSEIESAGDGVAGARPGQGRHDDA